MTERKLVQEPYRALHFPFGFEQGDPLIICKDSRAETLRASASRLGIKGYYTGYLSMIGGRRFDKVLIDLSGLHMTHEEFVAFWNWIAECVMTSTSPKPMFEGVFFV